MDHLNQLKRAYIINRQEQIDALQSGTDPLFWFYGARILRAINALIELADGDEASAAALIIEWEAELA